jgi:hypothetical protein
MSSFDSPSFPVWWCWYIDTGKHNLCVFSRDNVSGEKKVVTKELPEKSDQFRFLRTTCFTNLKGSVGLILAKTSVMRISIPLDLSSRHFIALPCLIRSSRPIPLYTHYRHFYPRVSPFSFWCNKIIIHCRLHDDPYSVWVFKFAWYWTGYSHKTLRWCSEVWWYFTVSGQD